MKPFREKLKTVISVYNSFSRHRPLSKSERDKGLNKKPRSYERSSEKYSMQKCGGHDPALSELWCSTSAGARDLRNKLVGWAQKLRRSRARFLARWASGASELPTVQGRAGACRGSRACASERAPVATRCGAACNAMRGRLQRAAGPPVMRAVLTGCYTRRKPGKCAWAMLTHDACTQAPPPSQIREGHVSRNRRKFAL